MFLSLSGDVGFCLLTLFHGPYNYVRKHGKTLPYLYMAVLSSRTKLVSSYEQNGHMKRERLTVSGVEVRETSEVTILFLRLLSCGKASG